MTLDVWDTGIRVHIRCEALEVSVDDKTLPEAFEAFYKALFAKNDHYKNMDGDELNEKGLSMKKKYASLPQSLVNRFRN